MFIKLFNILINISCSSIAFVLSNFSNNILLFEIILMPIQGILNLLHTEYVLYFPYLHYSF